MSDVLEVVKVTIPNGGTTSNEVNVGAKRIVGIQMSAAWTAGAITFQQVIRETSAPATPTWGNVVDPANAAVSLATPTADTYMAIADSVALRGLGRIRLVAGAAQGAERVLFLHIVG